MAPENASVEFDDYACDGGYPEHDYVWQGEEDGISAYLCRRCGAETDDFEEGSIDG